jgi:peptidoglycan/xylan/chitin deacetylase (PgdA/CDA1 family)
VRGAPRDSQSADCAATVEKIPVVITIDTEPDDAWGNHQNPSVTNVQGLLRLQRLLDRYDAKATCLVSYRVIQDDRATEVLRALVEEGGAEIGAHLHPWETPPFLDSGLEVRYPAYPHELPLELFARKLDCLTEAITRRFGGPRSYRAGRWGLAAAHLPALERLGYEVDSSVIPWIDWRRTPGIPMSQGGRGGIDYRSAPHNPYHPSYEDVVREGQATLVEVPVTVGFTRRVPSILRSRYGKLPELLKRCLRKAELVRPVWAVPPRHTRSHLANMLAVLVKRGAMTINISLHSSQLVLGTSPTSRTASQVDGVFARIEAMLDIMASHQGYEFKTLTEAARQVDDPAKVIPLPGPDH